MEVLNGNPESIAEVNKEDLVIQNDLQKDLPSCSNLEINDNTSDIKSIVPSTSTDTGFGSDSAVSTPGPEIEGRQIVSDIVSDINTSASSLPSGENICKVNEPSKDIDKEDKKSFEIIPNVIDSSEDNPTVEDHEQIPDSSDISQCNVNEDSENVQTLENKSVEHKTDDKKLEDTLSSSTVEGIDNHANRAETEDSEVEEKSIDILGNGFLKKKVLVPGKGVSTRPISGDTVTIKASGVLEDGVSINDENLTFILNDGDVIMAFDLAVALMEKDEKCEVITDARYAYGSMGREPDIPKDATITYNIELLAIQPGQEISSLSPEQRVQMGEAKRERGNYLYGRKDYTGAINSYSKATKILDDTDLNASLDEQTRDLLTETYVKCYNNMAACQLKVEALDAAIRSCEKVLAVKTDNLKALFRIGKAYSLKNEVDVALKYLKQGIKLDPEGKLFHQEVLALARRKAEQSQSEKEMYRKMLGVEGETAWEAKRRKEKEGESSYTKIMKWGLVAGSVAAVVAGVGYKLVKM